MPSTTENDGMKGTIRKTDNATDYINFRTNKVNTGKAFEIVLENGLEMWLPQSWSKKRVIEYVQSQVGGVELTEVAA
tara:strand:- start:1677 stop:1907 length:231 start_codon:yes stop_codon:yes gene_type:complete